MERFQKRWKKKKKKEEVENRQSLAGVVLTWKYERKLELKVGAEGEGAKARS